MSGLSVATCMERSERFERRLRIFELHTFNEEVGKEEGRKRDEGGGKECC